MSKELKDETVEGAQTIRELDHLFNNWKNKTNFQFWIV